VHVGVLGSDAPPYDAPHPELMLHAAARLALGAMDAVAAGCGMGGSASARFWFTANLCVIMCE
ncbi:hypothetical protein AB4Y44_42075, partial [Paraburkholderia sp. BR10937]|uniref:hypothetical protein n=1 Tax=Paraburkholderia sp. BR10937 TaxID=3236994 RepID=UPI0034D2B6B9